MPAKNPLAYAAACFAEVSYHHCTFLHCSAAPAGLEGIAQLTQLTALHLIQGDGSIAGWPLPTAAITCLSTLTGLRHLRTDTGGGAFAHSGDLNLGYEQAHAWSVVLQDMQQLTRLELNQAVLCDPLLLAIGAAGLPQLQVLVLDAMDLGFQVETTAEGAGAVAHIPHLELSYWKNFCCVDHEPLLRLPSLRKMRNARLSGVRGVVDAVLQGWSEETCNCESCISHRFSIIRQQQNDA
jgi:hypothetical protein